MPSSPFTTPRGKLYLSPLQTVSTATPRESYKQPSVANTSVPSVSPIRSPGSGAGYNMLAGYNPAGSGGGIDPAAAAALGAVASAIFGGSSGASPADLASQVLSGGSGSIVDKAANALTGNGGQAGQAQATTKPTAQAAPSSTTAALNKLKAALASGVTGAAKTKLPTSFLSQLLTAAAKKTAAAKTPTGGGVAGGSTTDQTDEEQTDQTDEEQTDQTDQTDEADTQDQVDQADQTDQTDQQQTDTTSAEADQTDATGSEDDTSTAESQQDQSNPSDATVDDVNTALSDELGIQPDVVDLGDNFFYDKTSGNVYELEGGSLTDVTDEFQSAFDEYGSALPDFSVAQGISDLATSLPDIKIGDLSDLIPDFDASQFDLGGFDLGSFSDLSLDDLGQYFDLPIDEIDWGSFDTGGSEDWGDFWGKKGGLAHLKNGGSAKVKTKYGLPRFEDGDLVDASEIDPVSTEPEYSVNGDDSWDGTMAQDVNDYDVDNMSVSENMGNESDSGMISGGDDSGNYGYDYSTDSGMISGGDDSGNYGYDYSTDYGSTDAEGRTVETTPDGINIYRDNSGKIVKVTDPNGYDITEDARQAALNGDDPAAAEQFAQPDDVVRTVYNPDGTRQEVTRSGKSVTYDKSGQVMPDRFSLSQLGSDIKTAFTSGKGPLTSIGTLLKNPIIQGGVTAGLLAQIMGGGSDKSYKGVDMSKVGQIAPRTTPFGMGPARTVSLGEATSMSPEQQMATNASLGVPGYSTQYAPSAAPALPAPTAGVPQPAPAQRMATGGLSHYTYGSPVDPYQNLGIERKRGGLSRVVHPESGVPVVQGRHDYREGSRVTGAGDGQSDDIPAMLADGEYVIDAELVSMLGNGSTKAGAEVLDKFREQVRKHKRSAPLNKIPPKSKSPLTYLKEAQNG